VKQHNPIRAAALVIVAIIGAYIMWMGWRLSNILSSSEWCGKSLQAERISNQNFGGLTACVDLLKIQLKAVATDSHIFAGVVAFVLLVLVVIVIAGGRVSFKASKTGVEGDMSSADALPVQVVNTPAAPVPTAEAPKPTTPPADPGRQMP
jgi:uncharacterized membrane protein